MTRPGTTKSSPDISSSSALLATTTTATTRRGAISRRRRRSFGRRRRRRRRVALLTRIVGRLPNHATARRERGRPTGSCVRLRFRAIADLIQVLLAAQWYARRLLQRRRLQSLASPGRPRASSFCAHYCARRRHDVRGRRRYRPNRWRLINGLRQGRGQTYHERHSEINKAERYRQKNGINAKTNSSAVADTSPPPTPSETSADASAADETVMLDESTPVRSCSFLRTNPNFAGGPADYDRLHSLDSAANHAVPYRA